MSSSFLRFFALSALLLGAALPAAAQTVVGGSRERPAVEVNLDVLNSLGPPPTLPDRLRGQSPLHRPETTAASPRHSAGKAALHHRTKHRKQKHKTVAARHKHRAKTTAIAKSHRSPAHAAPVAAAPRESVTALPVAEHTAAPPAPAVTMAVAPGPGAVAPGPGTAAISAPTPLTLAAAPAAVTPAPAPQRAPTVLAAPTIPAPKPSAAALTVMNTPPAIATESALPPAVTPAAAPAALSAVHGRAARVLFGAGASDIPDSAKGALKTIAQRLAANGQARLQLMAYAAGTADEANQARRLSLSRALAVRTYLMEQGVRSSRMDVRALGNRLDGSDPPDRVDIVMLDH